MTEKKLLGNFMTNMRTQHKIMTMIALTLLSTVATAEDDVHINKDCDNSTPMIEINDCASRKFAEADAEMNALYNEKLATAKSTASKMRLRDAQRAWLAFRDKTCLYEAGLESESGSIWPFQQFGCMEYHTRRRVQDIQVYLSCTSDDCP